MGILFGPGGNADRFFEEGNKSSLQMPKWLHGMGLDAYEYQCGRGVKISDDSAQTLGEEARKYGIALSIHSPYYINLATPDPQKQENSMGYILQSAHAAKQMGASRVVVHMGAAGKLTRAEGIALSKQLILRTLQEMDDRGYGEVTLCLETMGKVNQLGTVEETISVCQVDDRLFPAIDFGHVNAREQGQMNIKDILDQLENGLGAERAKKMHVHFSKIEYTHMGEKKHLTFADTVYGPDFEPLADELVRRGGEPVIICESAGTQAEDALAMKQIYQEKR